MRAVTGYAEGGIVRLQEPLPETTNQEVIVLIPTEADEQGLDILLFAGLWSDMPEEQWQALLNSLREGVRM